MKRFLRLLAIVLCAASARAEEADPETRKGWADGLQPGVNRGLAAKYPGDVGLESAPGVLAVERFEGVGNVFSNLSGFLTLTREGPPFSGRGCGVDVWKKGEGRGMSYIPIARKSRTVFVRCYYNFDKSLDPAGSQKGYVGLKGLAITAGRDYHAGEKPTGRDFYSASIQFFSRQSGLPGRVDCSPHHYIPYREGVKETGSGHIGAARFNEWHCYEVGVYLNTPGKADGEIRIWLDGVLQSRQTQVRLRDVEDLYPRTARIGHHRTDSSQECPGTMKRYMDNLVIATRYIGPCVKRSGGWAAGSKPAEGAGTGPDVGGAFGPRPAGSATDAAEAPGSKNQEPNKDQVSKEGNSKPAAAPTTQPETKNQKPETEDGAAVLSTEAKEGSAIGTVAAVGEEDQPLIGKVVTVTLQISAQERKVFCVRDGEARACAAARSLRAGDIVTLDYRIHDSHRWIQHLTAMGHVGG